MSREGVVIWGRLEIFDMPDLADALCKNHPDPDLFFRDSAKAQKARDKICPECPVRNACEAYGDTQEYGVWGNVIKKTNV